MNYTPRYKRFITALLFVVLCFNVFNLAVVFADFEITAEISTSKTGNIFFDETPTFTVKLTNNSNSALIFKADCAVYEIIPSADGSNIKTRELVETENISREISANSSISSVLTFEEVERYGLYEIEILSNDSVISSAPFSKVKYNISQNKKVGINFHYQDRPNADVDALMSLAKSAGIGNVRDQLGWNHLEKWTDSTKTETKYSFTPEAEKFFAAAQKYDMNVLALLVTGNNCYDVRDKITNWDSDETLTSSSFLREVTVEKYKDFLNWLLSDEKFKSAVSTIEVLNEPDIKWNVDGYNVRNNSDGAEKRAEAYARTIKTVYETVADMRKQGRADYDVGVLSLANIYNDNSKEMVDRVFSILNDGTENSPYFDTLTLHPYEPPSWNDLEEGRFGKSSTLKTQSQANNINYWRSLIGGKSPYYDYSKGTENKTQVTPKGIISGQTYDFNVSDSTPIWHTEFGFSSAPMYDSNDPDSGIPNDNDGFCVGDEYRQAYLLMRGLGVIQANNFNDIVQVYEMSCRGLSNGKEDNFGIVNCHTNDNNIPYSARYAFAALSNYNSLTSGANECEMHSEDYKFDCTYKKGRIQTHMLWTTKTDGAVTENTFENPNFYDLFGNIIDSNDIVDLSGNIKLTEVPIYAVETIKIPFEQKSVIPVYSDDFENYIGTETDNVLPDGFELLPGINTDMAKRIYKVTDSDSNSMLNISKWAPMNFIFDEVIQSGKVHVSFDMQAMSDDVTAWIYRADVKNGDNVANDIFKGDNIDNYNLSLFVSAKNYAPGTASDSHTDTNWHKYELCIDFDNNKFYAYKDGARKQISGASGIKGLRIQGSSAKIDNLYINHFLDESDEKIMLFANSVQSENNLSVIASLSEYSDLTNINNLFSVCNKTTGQEITNALVEKAETGYKISVENLPSGLYQLKVNEDYLGKSVYNNFDFAVCDYSEGEIIPMCESIKTIDFNKHDADLLSSDNICISADTEYIEMRFTHALTNVDNIRFSYKDSENDINLKKELSPNRKTVKVYLSDFENLIFDKEINLTLENLEFDQVAPEKFMKIEKTFSVNSAGKVFVNQVRIGNQTTPKPVYKYTNGVKGQNSIYTVPSKVYPVSDPNNVKVDSEQLKIMVDGFNSTGNEVPVISIVSNMTDNEVYSMFLKNVVCDETKVVPKGRFKLIFDCNNLIYGNSKVMLWNRNTLAPLFAATEFFYDN